MKYKYVMRILLLLVASALHLLSFADPVKVEVKEVNGKWSFYRDGKPYEVKGAGGNDHLRTLVEIGGNCIRTWSTDNALEILDAAQAKGLTVMMGLWAQHERHGFDYDDPVKVKAQLDAFRSEVMAIKDHPALLMWGVGNEVDLFYTNTNVWYAIEDIAKMIHEVDPNHPTCTVTAGLDKEEVRLIKERAPSIDVYGINTYGDLGNIKKNIRDYGWTGPYVISEWGPNGHWEVAKTEWNVPIEQSSHEKAIVYEERYRDYIVGDADHCIGSFIFLWGQKQETTATWYGLFSERGETSEVLDRIQNLWTGKAATNKAPILDSCKLNGGTKSENVKVVAGDKMEVVLKVSDPENDRLVVNWLIVPESTDIKSGGDAESAPLPVKRKVTKGSKDAVSIYAPSEDGGYRLFVFVYDGHGHYAYDNIPFWVNKRSAEMGQARGVQMKKFDSITP